MSSSLALGKKVTHYNFKRIENCIKSELWYIYRDKKYILAKRNIKLQFYYFQTSRYNNLYITSVVGETYYGNKH